MTIMDLQVISPQINVRDPSSPLQTHLAAESGEEVIIARNGEPVR